MLFYSIRVIEAETKAEAIEQLQNGELNFVDSDPLCDVILSPHEVTALHCDCIFDRTTLETPKQHFLIQK